ncbi:hypothetical protein F4780DRAFT_404631 [Xylariomycetidae sp. FL0641]|nr:hypothetical protein F4780DRAFT_404631 [Xylariomycetidae sp. FL0641]
MRLTFIQADNDLGGWLRSMNDLIPTGPVSFACFFLVIRPPLLQQWRRRRRRRQRMRMGCAVTHNVTRAEQSRRGGGDGGLLPGPDALLLWVCLGSILRPKLVQMKLEQSFSFVCSVCTATMPLPPWAGWLRACTLAAMTGAVNVTGKQSPRVVDKTGRGRTHNTTTPAD